MEKEEFLASLSDKQKCFFYDHEYESDLKELLMDEISMNQMELFEMWKTVQPRIQGNDVPSGSKDTGAAEKQVAELSQRLAALQAKYDALAEAQLNSRDNTQESNSGVTGDSSSYSARQVNHIVSDYQFDNELLNNFKRENNFIWLDIWRAANQGRRDMQKFDIWREEAMEEYFLSLLTDEEKGKFITMDTSDFVMLLNDEKKVVYYQWNTKSIPNIPPFLSDMKLPKDRERMFLKLIQNRNFVALDCVMEGFANLAEQYGWWKAAVTETRLVGIVLDAANVDSHYNDMSSAENDFGKSNSQNDYPLGQEERASTKINQGVITEDSIALPFPTSQRKLIEGKNNIVLRRIAQETRANLRITAGTGNLSQLVISSINPANILAGCREIMRRFSFHQKFSRCEYDSKLVNFIQTWSIEQKLIFEFRYKCSIIPFNSEKEIQSMIMVKAWTYVENKTACAKLKELQRLNKKPSELLDGVDELKKIISALDEENFIERLPQCVNILILGETGVGKSTFLNAMVNYLKFESLDEAERNGPEVVEAAKFTYTDLHEPVSYLYVLPGKQPKHIRFIDTPGIGDPRGVIQDEKNFEKIMSYIADFPEIHAIMILVKPDLSRLTTSFKHCIQEMLCRLHKNTSRNIIFGFTHAKKTFYRPRSSYNVLGGLLANLQSANGVEIPLSSSTAFCFESDSFHYLAARSKKIEFLDAEKERYKQSWKYARRETIRLFEHIYKLQPHNVNDTLCIHNTRKVIQILAKPLAKITKKLLVNQELLERKLEEIRQLQNKGTALSQVTNEEVQRQIDTNTDEMGIANMLIQYTKEQITILTEDKEKILNHRWEFAFFLSQNCLLVVNDTYSKYLERLIQAEKNNPSTGNYDQRVLQLEQLELHRDSYQAQTRLLRNASESITKNTPQRSVDEIHRIIEELRGVEICGSLHEEIQELEIHTVRSSEMYAPRKIELPNWKRTVLGMNAAHSFLKMSTPLYSNFEHLSEKENQSMLMVKAWTNVESKTACAKLKELQRLNKKPSELLDGVDELKKIISALDEENFIERLPQCVNILILGETGVGKSTFLNAMVNYLKFESLDEAERNGPEVVEAANFTYTDLHEPVSYLYVLPGKQPKHIRFIDTPGIGDPRGVIQDEKNFEKIMSYIADFPEIHAIMILVKPDLSRLTTSFKHCIQEMLCRLHKNTSRNIIFGFTHAKKTFYRPRSSYNVLGGLLANLQSANGVEIPLSSSTAFCFESDSFHYLAARSKKIEFLDEEKERYKQSWKYARRETIRLFEHIYKLQPHNVNDTLCIHNTRKVIQILAKPLAKITKKLLVNQELLERKLEEIHQLQHKGTALSQVTNEEVQRQIDTNTDEMGIANMIIQKTKEQITILTEDKEKILNHRWEFAFFLSQNCLLVVNDTYSKYLERLIQAEENKPSTGNYDQRVLQLEQLKLHRDSDQAQTRLLRNASESITKNTPQRSVDEIHRIIEELRGVEICGSLHEEIQELEIHTVRSSEMYAPRKIELPNWKRTVLGL